MFGLNEEPPAYATRRKVWRGVARATPRLYFLARRVRGLGTPATLGGALDGDGVSVE